MAHKGLGGHYLYRNLFSVLYWLWIARIWCFVKNVQSRANFCKFCISKILWKWRWRKWAEKMVKICKKLNTFCQISQKKAKKGLIPARRWKVWYKSWILSRFRIELGYPSYLFSPLFILCPISAEEFWDSKALFCKKKLVNLMFCHFSSQIYSIFHGPSHFFIKIVTETPVYDSLYTPHF